MRVRVRPATLRERLRFGWRHRRCCPWSAILSVMWRGFGGLIHHHADGYGVFYMQHRVETLTP